MKLRVPGDKSITQRALILAALADGESRLRGLLPAADPRSTAGALRALGATIPPIPDDGREIRVRGVGLRGFRAPAGPLDLGNSGTGARLMLGVLAAQPFATVVTGDASLRTRPMARVTDPLETMGARFRWLEEPGCLPLEVLPARGLLSTELDLPVASAQVKSALLLAGLVGRVPVLLTEPGLSRDHTERMFTGAGATVVSHVRGPGRRVELRDPPETLRTLDLTVPGDPSSAAFPVLASLLGVGEGWVEVEGVGLNPTRTGFVELFRAMGGSVEVEETGDEGGELTGVIRARAGDLRAIQVGHDRVVRAIDELPAVAVAAARAAGVTRITGAGELRVKETDRIRAMVDNLRAVGVTCTELEDGLEIRGTDVPLSGVVDSRDDHRIAMVFGILGAQPGNDIRVQGAEAVEVSYPGFWDQLEALQLTAPQLDAPKGKPYMSDHARYGPDDPRARSLVTLDGPAGVGKSTTARAVAREMGYRYLDSGALYRAVTWALLHAGIRPEDWPDLDTETLDGLGIRVVPEGQTLSIRVGNRTLEEELRTARVTELVPAVARVAAVRRWLLGAQRSAASRGRLVADGRDMGSVVFPQARAKVFLQADLRERARRRLGDKGVPEPGEGDIDAESRRLAERDRQDSERVHSPLVRPEDALVVDTTSLTFAEQVDRIVDYATRAAVDPAGPAE